MPCVGALVAPRLGCWIVAEEPEPPDPPPEPVLDEDGGGDESTGALGVTDGDEETPAPEFPVLPVVVPLEAAAVALADVTGLTGCGAGMCAGLRLCVW